MKCDGYIWSGKLDTSAHFDEYAMCGCKVDSGKVL